MTSECKIAYFSMEIGLDNSIPTYSGGLGVLAGDTIRSAADMKLPMLAVSLLHRKGYFNQTLDESGWQHSKPVEWDISSKLKELDARTSVTISGRRVYLRAWKYKVVGYSGHVIPVYFLGADIPENSEWDRSLTDYLYGGDNYYRFCQEVILGIGGLRMLRALGYVNIERFHMNEGHAALLAAELLQEQMTQSGKNEIDDEDVEAIREKCVFTTHTPVPAGHDKFPLDMVRHVLGSSRVLECEELCHWEDSLNMTYLALNLSGFVNGVAKKHAEVSQHLFAHYRVDSITNGVHASTWICPSIQKLLDRYIHDWRSDNYSLRYAEGIPLNEVWETHQSAKRELMDYINKRHNLGMNVDAFTIGFARRAATYKRADLFFYDIDRLRKMATEVGPIQVVYAGKAHPADDGGKRLIQRIFQAQKSLKDEIKVVYLENYDMSLGKLLTSGVDLWLNTPRPPLEASGTSGMKAAMNGIPSLSILDGWWIEGCIEGVTGWAIDENGQKAQSHEDYSADAKSLYDKLNNVILPLFYHRQRSYIRMMRHCIAINGSFFTTERMMHQYVLKAYFR